MRNALIALAAISSIAAPALAQSADAPIGDYALDKTHASLTWKVKHQSLSYYTARFTHFDADLMFNAKDVSKSKLSVTIDPKSVETDYAQQRPANSKTDFNAELADQANFFNSGVHKTITFKSTAVTKTSDTTGTVTGDLTFLGVTKPVSLQISYVGDRNDPRAQKHKIGFSARGTIKRSDWGMTWGVPSIGDEVELLIESEFVQK